VSGPLAFTPNLTNAALGASVSVTLISNGANAPTFDGFSEWGSTRGYDNSQAGLVNTVTFWYDGIAARYSVSQPMTNSSVLPDTTAPLISSVAVANSSPTVVAVTFNEPMNAAAVPASSAFTVSGHTVVAVAYASSTVLDLTVTPAFVNGEAARTLSYTQPGSNGLRDVAGNLLATASALAINNSVLPSDVTPPTVASAIVSTATPGIIALTFNETMDTAFTPSSAAFAVSNGISVTGVAWSGQTLRVSVTPAFAQGESGRTITYTQPGSGAARDAAGNLLASFASLAVTNNVSVDPSSAMRLTGLTNLTESGDGTAGWNYKATSGAAYTGYGVSSVAIPAGAEGYFEVRQPDSGGVSIAILGLKTSSASQNYTSFAYAVQPLLPGTGSQRYIQITGSAAGAAPNGATVLTAVGQRYRIGTRVNGANLDGYIEVSTDAGVTWTLVHTWASIPKVAYYAGLSTDTSTNNATNLRSLGAS
jgi:hypothetical protein